MPNTKKERCILRRSRDIFLSIKVCLYCRSSTTPNILSDKIRRAFFSIIVHIDDDVIVKTCFWIFMTHRFRRRESSFRSMGRCSSSHFCWWIIFGIPVIKQRWGFCSYLRSTIACYTSSFVMMALWCLEWHQIAYTRAQKVWGLFEQL